MKSGRSNSGGEKMSERKGWQAGWPASESSSGWADGQAHRCTVGTGERAGRGRVSEMVGERTNGMSNMDGRMFVRHEIYRDQTIGARIANLGKHMHVDKVSTSTNFHPILWRSMTFAFKVKYSNGVSSEVHPLFSRKPLTDRAEIAIYNARSRIWTFDWNI